MAKLHKIYTADDDQTFQLIFPNRPADFNQTLAAFLILRSKYALFQFGVIGPYECAAEPCGKPNSPAGGYGPYQWSPLLDEDWGHPVGSPTVSASGAVWTREWSNATISLSCTTWQATFNKRT
jgi:hypothetical protein